MWTKLHWVDGPWPGRLALVARPRGGDSLSEELASWHSAGVSTVLSLLTAEEERDLDLAGEAVGARHQGLQFRPYPIADRHVPDSESSLAEELKHLDSELTAGTSVALHCRQGIGRTGLVAACLLISKGIEPDTALAQLSAARGVAVPETDEQFRWIKRFASRSVARKSPV